MSEEKEIDPEEWNALLEKAENGDPEAQTILSNWQKTKQAKAEKGDPDAQHVLATAYYNGVGGAKDITKGVEWLLKAADQGHIKAIGNLWFHYSQEYGQGSVEALKWCRKMAELGNGHARRKLDQRANATGASEIRLTKEVAEIFLGGSFIDDELNMYTAIEDDAAEALAAYETGLSLKLHGITSLSEEAAENLGNSTIMLELNGLTELNVATARLLSKQRLIFLDCLTELSDVAAETLIGSLIEGNFVISLNGLTALSDAAAESLGKYKGTSLFLKGIRTLSETAAESLAEFPNELFLNGLESLSSARLAKKLASMRVLEQALDFKNLTSLSDAAAESLSSHKDILWLKRLTQLTDAAAESLSRHQGTLYLPLALKDGASRQRVQATSSSKKIEHAEPELPITDADLPKEDATQGNLLSREIAERFLQNDYDSDDWINLEEFTAIEDAAAEALSGNPGPWHLNSLTVLSVASAEWLSRQKCQKYWPGNGLYLNGLKHICDGAAQSLSNHKGVLEMNSLKRLSDSAAESLSLRWGTLSLDGLTELSDSAAESFSGFFGIGNSRPWLSLDGLAELSDAAAEKLSLFPGSILNLRGLRKLSAVGAESLAKYEGDLNLTQELQAKVDSFKEG